MRRLIVQPRCLVWWSSDDLMLEFPQQFCLTEWQELVAPFKLDSSTWLLVFFLFKLLGEERLFRCFDSVVSQNVKIDLLQTRRCDLQHEVVKM